MSAVVRGIGMLHSLAHRLKLRTRSVLAPIVVEKGLGSTRAGTKAKGLDILLMYIEVDVVDPVIVSIPLFSS